LHNQGLLSTAWRATRCQSDAACLSYATRICPARHLKCVCSRYTGFLKRAAVWHDCCPPLLARELSMTLAGRRGPVLRKRTDAGTGARSQWPPLQPPPRGHTCARGAGSPSRWRRHAQALPPSRLHGRAPAVRVCLLHKIPRKKRAGRASHAALDGGVVDFGSVCTQLNGAAVVVLAEAQSKGEPASPEHVCRRSLSRRAAALAMQPGRTTHPAPTRCQ